VADGTYIKAEGKAGRIGRQAMAVVFTRPKGREDGKRQTGKVYLSADDLPAFMLPDDEAIRRRLDKLCEETGLTVPTEPIEANPRSFDTQHFGFERWRDLFTPRQLLALMTFCKHVRAAHEQMLKRGIEEERAKAVTTYLGLLLSKVSDLNNSLCHYEPVAQCPRQMFCRQAVPMVWDFGESVLPSQSTGSWSEHLGRVTNCIEITKDSGVPGSASRGSATRLPFGDSFFDGVVTDPPYYDNVTYSNLADFFYVWIKRTVGHLYPEHFAGELTPKRNEAIVAAYRHNGDRKAARGFYEDRMAESLAEARRVLKPNAPMVMVYAHKTMAGWGTLVDALRRGGFVIGEAWPVDTENRGRTIAAGTAALASSIFLVARRRESEATGSYETEVRPELEAIVRERVKTLWEQGITGADLVIAAVGAGLRAYTQFARVEYANGDEVPADAFLHEVEGVVLETLLERIFGVPRSGVAAVDAPTRFYVLWRYTYRQAELDGGEAIVFAYPQGVELDGPRGLSAGARALVEKKKGKYHLRSFDERGSQEALGQPGQDGAAAPVVDVLHRTLWLMEHRPAKLGEFLDQSVHGRAEQMRLVAHALAGPSLHGGNGGFASTPEVSALRTLTANWKAVVEENLFR
jgi:putative DNA methylase